jgi:hypothetical protein
MTLRASLLMMCHAVAVLLSTLLFGGTALAQATCIPVAVGVPGQSGPPAWWGGGSGPIDDPRWQGAMSVGHDNDDAQFRALRYTDGGQSYLVLSWEVKADTGPATAGQDQLFVGFWDTANDRGNVIRITRNLSATEANGTFAAGAFTAEVRYRDASTAGAWNLVSAIPPVPAWVQNDALFGAVCTMGAGAQCTRWNVRMRVPVGAASPVSNPALGLPLSSDFRMWYELRVEHASGAPVPIVRHKWPATAPNVVDLPLTYPDPGNAAHFANVSTASSPCAGGVRLDYAHITTDNTPSTAISTTAPNVFHARPINETVAPIAGNAVRARFRVANWGSVLFDSPEWIDINPSAPSCASATGAAPNVAPGSSFDLTCSWTLTAEQQCAYRPDVHNTCSPMPAARHPHQCVLVELSSTTGVVFSRASAWNNMNFVTASRVEQSATVSLRGLPGLPGATRRDVYLAVSTHNMPEAPVKNPDRPRDDVKPFLPVSTKEGARLQQLAASGQLTLAELATRMPTYIVRVYYDSGDRFDSGGTQYADLVPMPSFGYHVMHDGEIEGWKHSLTAAGAVELAPNFYKLAIENDGAAEVVTAIEAVEPGTPPVAGSGAAGAPGSDPTPGTSPPSAWLWIALAVLVLMLLLWLILRRR